MTGILSAYLCHMEAWALCQFEVLAKNGLIGKIRLTSDMTEDAIFKIKSVFRGPMGNSDSFDFDVLQSTGGSSKSLAVPSVSDSFKWTASNCFKEC